MIRIDLFAAIVVIIISSCSLEKNNTHSRLIEKRQHMAGYHMKGFKKNSFKNRFTKKENKAFKQMSSSNIAETTEFQTTSSYKEDVGATNYHGLYAGNFVPIEVDKVSIPSLSNSNFKEKLEIGEIENSRKTNFRKSKPGLIGQNEADSGSINWTKDLPYQRRASKSIDVNAHYKIIKDAQLLRTIFNVIGVVLSVLAPFSFGLTLLLAIPFFAVANNKKKKLRAQERQLLVEHGSKEELQKTKQQHLSDFEANHKISKITRILTIILAFLMLGTIPILGLLALAGAGTVGIGWLLFAIPALVGLITSIIHIKYRSKARHNYRTAEMASKKLGKDLPTKTQLEYIDNQKSSGIMALFVSIVIPAMLGGFLAFIILSSN